MEMDGVLGTGTVEGAVVVLERGREMLRVWCVLGGVLFTPKFDFSGFRCRGRINMQKI